MQSIADKTGNKFAKSGGTYDPLYASQAEHLWTYGLFLGTDNSFNLDKRITRAEGCVLILRLQGLEETAKAKNLNCTFTDVPAWAKPYVAYAAQEGMVKGYSTTEFGANDYMTADQYLTLVLRMLGYEDNVDFTWDKAADKALSIELIGEPCHKQYLHSNLFMRDNVAVISDNALFTAKTKSGKLLSDDLTLTTKNTGQSPYATATLKAQSNR